MVVSLEISLLYIALCLVSSLITIKFIISYYFYNIYKKQSKEYKNELILAIGLLFLLFGIGRIIFLYFDFFLTELNGSLFQEYSTFWKFASGFQYAGLIVFIYFAEKVIFNKKTKYLISLSLTILIIVSLSMPDFLLVQSLSGISSFISFIFIPFSYLYLVFTSSGKIRIKALTIFFGFLLYGVGLVMLGEQIILTFLSYFPSSEILVRYSFQIISVLIKFCALVLFIYGFKEEK